MPDTGRLQEHLLPATTPLVGPLYPAPPWKLPGAQVLKVLFETDAEPVLDSLPPKLSRSSPPYAVVSVERFPETPVGPFSLATQYIGCRAGFFIRAFALQAVVDSAEAMAALREVWGIPCRLGEVSLASKRGTVKAGAALAGQSLVDLSLQNAEAIDFDSLRIDPVISLRLVPSLKEGVRHDLVQLLQLDPDYVVRDAARGVGAVSYPEGSSWACLPVRNVISATWCTLDTELPLARFVIPY